MLQQFLHCYFSHQQDNWPDLLSFAEFAYNDSLHSLVGMSLFQAVYVYNLGCWTVLPLWFHEPLILDNFGKRERVQSYLNKQLDLAKAIQKCTIEHPIQESLLWAFTVVFHWIFSFIQETRLEVYQLFHCHRPVQSVTFCLQPSTSMKVRTVFYHSLLVNEGLLCPLHSALSPH